MDKPPPSSPSPKDSALSDLKEGQRRGPPQEPKGPRYAPQGLSIIGEALVRFNQWDESVLGLGACRKNFTPTLTLPRRRGGENRKTLYRAAGSVRNWGMEIWEVNDYTFVFIFPVVGLMVAATAFIAFPIFMWRSIKAERYRKIETGRGGPEKDRTELVPFRTMLNPHTARLPNSFRLDGCNNRDTPGPGEVLPRRHVGRTSKAM